VLFLEMPRRIIVRRRWISERCWLCALSNVRCGFTSEQNLDSTRCMSIPGGNLFGSDYLPLPSMGIIST
jgi:hypothetical protein